MPTLRQWSFCFQTALTRETGYRQQVMKIEPIFLQVWIIGLSLSGIYKQVILYLQKKYMAGVIVSTHLHGHVESMQLWLSMMLEVCRQKL